MKPEIQKHFANSCAALCLYPGKTLFCYKDLKLWRIDHFFLSDTNNFPHRFKWIDNVFLTIIALALDKNNEFDKLNYYGNVIAYVLVEGEVGIINIGLLTHERIYVVENEMLSLLTKEQ